MRKVRAWFWYVIALGIFPISRPVATAEEIEDIEYFLRKHGTSLPWRVSWT